MVRSSYQVIIATKSQLLNFLLNWISVVWKLAGIPGKLAVLIKIYYCRDVCIRLQSLVDCKVAIIGKRLWPPMQIVWHVMEVCHLIITIIYFLASTPNICCTMSRDMLAVLLQHKAYTENLVEGKSSRGKAGAKANIRKPGPQQVCLATFKL